MGLTVTLVSGPRRSGKSLVAGLLVEEVLGCGPHYLRLTSCDGSKRPAIGINPPEKGCGVASAQWLCYERDRVFEVLPEALAAIHRHSRYGRVIIEADADPVLRHAYPYDQQIFVMPAPRSVNDVFRSSVQAARALQDALDDTTEFASEVFGLAPTEPAWKDEPSVEDDPRDERDLLSQSQIRRFLHSQLGDELAVRMQLHPEYHGLIESDVVLVNVGASRVSRVAERRCCERLEQLLARLEPLRGPHRPVFCCDPLDATDPRRAEFLQTLRTVCGPPH